MAAAESFREEASCSLCLGFFRDPVSIHCGHNFCRGCITRRWADARENFPCPLCRETAPRQNLRPNRELAKLIEIAKRLSLRAARGGAGGEKLCQKHREALKLFCEEEGTPICLVCRESQAHRAHPVVPIEEAAEEEKEKLQTRVGLLKDRREKLLGLKAAEEGKSLDLLERVEKEKQKVTSEAKELRRFLEGQEGLLLERLEKLEEEIRRRQGEKVKELWEEISRVGEEIQELEEKCQQPACELLLASRNISSRLEKEVPREEGEEPSDLLPHGEEILEAVTKYRVSLTLDPETAHPRLLLSPGGKGDEGPPGGGVDPPPVRRGRGGSSVQSLQVQAPRGGMFPRSQRDHVPAAGEMRHHPNLLGEGDPLLPTRLHLGLQLRPPTGRRRRVPPDLPLLLLRDRPLQPGVGRGPHGLTPVPPPVPP